MLDDSRPYTFDGVVRMLLTAGVLIGLFLLVRYLSDVLVPFVAAAALAYLLNPFVTRLERLTGRRGVAVALTLVSAAIVLIAALLILIPLMTGQWNRFQASLVRLRADTAEASARPASTASAAGADVKSDGATDAAGGMPARQQAEKTLGWAEFSAGWEEFRRDAKEMPRGQRLRRLLERIRGTYLGDAAEAAIAYVHSAEFQELALESVRRLFAGGISVISFAVEFVFGATVLIVVMIYLVFLLLDFPAYVRTWKAMLPDAYRQRVLAFLGEFEAALHTYFRGQTVVAAITGALFAIGFSIIGLPMAVPFGLFVGLLNIVPYLQTVALVPAFFLAIIRSIETGSLLASFVCVLLVFGAVQVLMDGMITPRIMGRATGLRPVSIMLGVFIWGKLLGFLGLLLAIPLTCLGIAYYRRLVLRREEAPLGG